MKFKLVSRFFILIIFLLFVSCSSVADAILCAQSGQVRDSNGKCVPQESAVELEKRLEEEKSLEEKRIEEEYDYYNEE